MGDNMALTVKCSGVACCEKVFEYSMPCEEAAETVVPDTLPDVERVLYAGGTVFLRGKEAAEGSVSVTGQVNATVLYAPEGGEGACTLGAPVQLALTLDAPGVTPDCPVTALLTVASVDAKPLNPRKLLIRAVVNVSVECLKPSSVELASGLEGEEAEQVETLCVRRVISPVICVKEKTFAVSDEYQLQPGLLPLGELLWYAAEPVPGTLRTVGSRLIFSGSLRVSALYAAEGSGELCSADFESEFSQMLDLDAELTNGDFELRTMLTAAYVEPATLAGGERGISAEFHLVTQCVCSDSLSVDCLTDCYSNFFELEPVRTGAETCRVQRRTTLRGSVSEILPASPPPVNICRAICSVGAAECENGALRCPVELTAIYLAADGEIYSVRRRVSCETPAELAQGDCAVSVTARCAECGAGITQGGVELRASVDFELAAARRESFEQISAVTLTEEAEKAPRPSVTVVRAGADDTLWSLAKRCRSTGALIKELNALEDAAPLAGRVLLIPAAR